MFLLIFLIVLITLLGVVYFTLRQKVTSHFPDTFPTAKNRSRIDHSKKVVVCFGDSNTHGNVSYDWVKDLSTQMPDYQFINAGKNSDLTYTLLNRIEDVIACKPDFVNILIGTNDVNSTMSLAMEKRYQSIGRVAKHIKPNFEGFCENYAQIVKRLKTETKAKISVMSLPVMGEDLSHEANLKADKYSEFLKKSADNEQINYLPVREKQKAFLQQNPQPLKHRFEETYKLLNYSVIAHYIFGKDWDYVTQRHGFQLTPDNLHQNSIAGGMIRDLLKDFLDSNKNA
jgi:lysophospholipase L1-like esterase